MTPWTEPPRLRPGELAMHLATAVLLTVAFLTLASIIAVILEP